MADPNKQGPSYNAPMQTPENLPENIPGEPLEYTYNFSHDGPTGENVILDENVNQFGHGTSEAGPSGGVNDQSNEHLNPENLNCGNPVPLLQWPVPPQPYSCTNCQVLREIIHTIAGESRKFEIHGRLGKIFHGILEIRRRGGTTAPSVEYQMFDFCKVPIPVVKTYLLNYCEERTEASYTLVKDPLLAFNEALSVGSDWDFGLDLDEILRGSPPPPPPIGEDVEQQPEATDSDDSEPQAESSRRRSKRKRHRRILNRSRNMKHQRNLCKGLGVKDFVNYFHLTIEEAAEKVGIGTTAFKEILRKEKFGWPSTKIRNIERQIANLSKDLESGSPRKRESAEAQIAKYKQDKENIYAPFR